MRQIALIAIGSLIVVLAGPACGRRDEPPSTSSPTTAPDRSPAAQPAGDAASAEIDNAATTLVGRLDLEKYKATIKGLTQFGDRQQGTDRNRAAVDWIESQLKSVGCTSTERIRYQYQPPATPRRRPARGPREGEGGSVMFGNRVPTSVNRDPEKQPDPKL